MSSKPTNPNDHAYGCGCNDCYSASYNTTVSKQTNPKDAIGCVKPPSSTVPQTVMAEVGLALLEGACKYGKHNFRVIGVRSSIYYDAARRHMDRWWEGTDIDKDSGLNHITKAIASLVVLRDAMIQDMLTDDRPPVAAPGFFEELEVKMKNILAKYPEPKAAYTEEGESKVEMEAQCIPPADTTTGLLPSLPTWAGGALSNREYIQRLDKLRAENEAQQRAKRADLEEEIKKYAPDYKLPHSPKCPCDVCAHRKADESVLKEQLASVPPAERYAIPHHPVCKCVRCTF